MIVEDVKMYLINGALQTNNNNPSLLVSTDLINILVALPVYKTM